MKLTFLLSLALLTITSSHANYFNDIHEDTCEEYLVTTNGEYDSSGDEMTCYDSEYADIVLSAKPDFKTEKTSNIYLMDVVELGALPDDSTSHLYNYEHNLLDKDGKIVGFYQTIAAFNSEGEWGVKLNNRYDINGQIVYSEATSL